MTTFNRMVMCAECPFREQAAPGWLGPWTIEEFEEFINSDNDLLCHVDYGQRKEAGQPQAKIEAEGQHCIGILRYRSSMCKLSRHADIAAIQTRLRSIKDQPLIPPWKFREHHDRHKVGRQKLPKKS